MLHLQGDGTTINMKGPAITPASEPKADGWTYLRRDDEGEWLPGEREKLPAPGTAFLAFETLRWAVVIGFIERPGGYTSILDPNVDDDCNIVAFAAINETRAPDMDKIHECSPWHEAAYKNWQPIHLMRAQPVSQLVDALKEGIGLIQSQHCLLVAAHEHIDWSHNEAVMELMRAAIASAESLADGKEGA